MTLEVGIVHYSELATKPMLQRQSAFLVFFVFSVSVTCLHIQVTKVVW